jgi:hypothetical protein
MTHRSTAGNFTAKRVLVSLLASCCLVAASPVVASSSAAGAHRSVSAGFGDCKNDNAGKHNGYDCPSSSGGSDTGGSDIATIPSIS